DGAEVRAGRGIPELELGYRLVTVGADLQFGCGQQFGVRRIGQPRFATEYLAVAGRLVELADLLTLGPGPDPDRAVLVKGRQLLAAGRKGEGGDPNAFRREGPQRLARADLVELVGNQVWLRIYGERIIVI